MEEQQAHHSQTPAGLPDGTKSALPLLAWGLFWRMIFAQAAPLFLLAAIICFFAFNWATMPAFAKFGVLGAALAASACLALWRGFESTMGSIALLFCGLCAGPLLAVYGQVYQTGADDWELFRAWCLFLLPLAILGRQNGLWLALWVTGNLWALLYLLHMSALNSLYQPLYLAAGQAAILLAWETAALTLAGANLPFLQARWFARLMALPPLILLTGCLIVFTVDAGSSDNAPVFSYCALYGLILTLGAFHYTRKRTDLVMIACGLLSLIALGAVAPFANFFQHGIEAFALRCFLTVLILTGGGAATVRIIKGLHQRILAPAGKAAPAEASPVLQRARFALSGALPAGSGQAAARLAGAPALLLKGIAGLSAWLALPFFMALVVLFFEPSPDTFIFQMLFVMALGAAISRISSGTTFTDQAALCLALSGALGAGVASAVTYPALAPYAPLSLLFAVGSCCVKSAVYRYLAAAIGIPVLAATLLFMPEDGRILRHGLHYANEPLPVLFFFLFCLILALAWDMAPAQSGNAGQGAWRRQTLAGCHLALLAMGLVLPQWPHVIEWDHGDMPVEALRAFWPTLAMIGVASAAGLACFALRLGRQLNLSLPGQALLIAVSAAFAAVSWKLPWFGAHVFALALARQAASLPLVGLTIISFAVSINLEYYFHNSTLLEKSFSLACIGLLLAAAAGGLHKALRSGTGKGLLPDPRLLYQDGILNAPGQESKGLPRPQRQAGQDAGAIPLQERQEPGLSSGAGFPRRSVFLVVLALFFSLFTWSVLHKEQLKANGNRLILALAPVDPRSLMQGDYMVLRFEIENAIRDSLQSSFSGDREKTDGYATGAAVVEVAQDRSAAFKRLDDGAALADKEKRLIFRKRRWHIDIGAGAFFFQEGHGTFYEKARFAELRVNEAGQSLITRLLDEDMKPIEAEKTPQGR